MDDITKPGEFSPAMEDVLRRLLYEPEFRKQFLDDRPGALLQYEDLTDGERNMLHGIPQEKADAVRRLPVPDPRTTPSRTEKAMIAALVALVAVGAWLATDSLLTTTVSTLGIRPTTLLVSHPTCRENLDTLQSILDERGGRGPDFPDLYHLMQRKVIGPEIRCPQGGEYRIIPLAGDPGGLPRPGIRCSLHGAHDGDPTL